MSKISFNNKQSPFFDALRKKVDHYFKENRKSPTGDIRLWSKTVILTCLGVMLYIALLWGNLPVWLSLVFCGLLGMTLAAIGFNVMHDGAHGSYSNNKSINTLMAWSLNLMGGSSFMWKIKHNHIHHSFTNIDGVDDDIDIRPFMRVSETQPRRYLHRFQHIYGFLLYGMTYFMWIYWMDFQKYFTRKVGPTPIRKMKLSEHLGFWLTKIMYLSIFVIIPVYIKGWADALLGYGMVLFVTGLFIAVVFQLAHVVESTTFPQPDPNTNKIEEEWALHQVRTTANFATRNRFISWFAGGLNFQVEHHLFPRISHIHYPAISRIVRETCAEFNIPYLEYPTFISAVNAHVRHLRAMGRA